ncbi:MAG: hypothetical protein IKZ26_04280 [Peptococcaceae bacterium]|nr:hypothetical protein [Peptococcaceae bacterium]
MLPLSASIVALKSTIQDEHDLALYSDYCDITHLNNPEAHLSVTLSWDQRRTRTASAQRLLDYVQANDINAWHLTTPDEVWQGRRNSQESKSE